MQELIITRGIIGSGKTTWAKVWEAESLRYRIVIERDEIREVMFNHKKGSGKLSPHQETKVTEIQTRLIKEHLSDGYSVCVSDTNINYSNVVRFRKMAQEFGVKFVVKTFDTPLETCILRNSQRPVDEQIPENVIKRMWKRMNIVKDYDRPFNVSADKQFAVVFDLDGTMFLMNGRNPFDEMSAGSDFPNMPVAIVLAGLKQAYPNMKFIALSGRKDKAMRVSVDALHDIGIRPDVVFMRSEDDNRKDSIVKVEFYERFILPNYNVLCHFDDRNQVVEAIRDLGVPVFQVAPGNF